jgi:O-antigen/teichoic acid export membrane protein
MFQRLVQIVTVLLLARLLTPAEYGIVSIAVVFTVFLDVVTNIQMGGAVSRLDHLEHAHLDTAFTLNLLRGIFSAAVTGLLAHPAAVFMHDPRLQTLLYVLMIPPLISGLQNPYFSLFARDLNFRQQSLREVVAFFIGAIAGISVAVAYHSYWALVVNGMTVASVRVIASYLWAPGRPGLSLSKTRDLFAFGGWITLVSVADYCSSRIDFLLIGNRIGTATVGAYNVANTLTTTITLDLVGTLTQALLPAYSTIASDTERLRRGYREVQVVTIALAMPLGFGISAVAPALVEVLVGGKWLQAIPAVQILAPVTAILTMTASVEAMAYTLGKGRLICIRAWLFLLVRAGFMFLGFSLGGFLGIIWARAGCSLIQLFYNLFLVQRLIGVPVWDQISGGWRSGIAGVSMWFAIIWLHLPHAGAGQMVQLILNLSAQIATGAFVYVGLHALLWALSGSPDGAEQRVVTQARRLTSRFFPSLQTPTR